VVIFSLKLSAQNGRDPAIEFPDCRVRTSGRWFEFLVSFAHQNPCTCDTHNFHDSTMSIRESLSRP